MNQPDHESFIAVGKFGSTYGVRGWLKIYSYTEYNAGILEYRPWYIEQDQNWVAIEIADGKVQSNTVLAKLSGIDSPEAARAFVNKAIYIKRAQLPSLKPNEFYWSDLIGLTVINHDGSIVGKVSYLIETGANDVLVVKGTKEHAIPYLMGTVVLSVDLEKQEIHVNWELI